ncbi:type I polyketide synthase [Streptomyces morookaense]|uniref:SDR family NAD(P)-dependent oxidoreductase n=1 Tax=Streptomyces morookaense TaxID=1970 RepID=A0A7Y7B0B5_STRMO|nr:type I polyketide synthase [Streptomyces morookaense]NVK76495.1 SDR family NAD(P)-dependent oxidoreductase [Streptomyces morookaense]GHF07528.1 polyketide synthase [Streptomyces morookaense]
MHQEPAAFDEHAIAVVGVSCRMPGGIAGMDDLWTALHEGRDLITRMPADRFDTDRFVNTDMPRPGKTYTAAGGFLDDIAGFDAAYFGISPKEAAHMDPQHRLLLELAAEALDDAAIAPERLAGTDTAVYVGICDASYAGLLAAEPRGMNAYTMSGTASSIAANRLSHVFDLRGPSMAVDTACSSSLVALDRACHTLWEGTSRTALCGGANILLSAFHYVGFCQASMLSPRGRCASFSAGADGFVRAEGGGMVVLKRLADALADGDRIHGVVLGSASNCDGRTLGLALPNAGAQEALLRRVYRQAGVHPDELVYLEAHGTGTAVGDPLEAQAIGRALGMRRITGPLPIGSVKTNVGHLEPASGIAGLCKALLVLRHGTIPASLHAQEPSPAIDFTGLGIDLVTENRPLARTPRPVIGVNSFGFGGANAHTILTAPPAIRPEKQEACVPPEGLPVLVSARTKPALLQAAARMAERLDGAGPEDFHDIAYTSCRRRGRHEHRAVVLAASAAEAARRLTALAEPGAGATTQAVRTGRVAFVYSGNGSQWAGMGADLLAADPVFRRTVTAVDAELTPLLGWSVADYLASPPEEWDLAATEIGQPLLFTVQTGLTAMLRDQGAEPAVVLGHSVGEVAAACTAGALTLAQAAQVIAERSRAQAATAGTGRMAAVGLAPGRAAEILQAYEGQLEIAGVNSAKDVTVTGNAEALAALGEHCAQQGVFFRDLDFDYAFHSRAMDPQHEPLTAALRDLRPHPADIPFCSTVTGTWIAGRDLDGSYWWRNLREPVAFARAMDEALDDGVDIFLEIGPHPVLRAYLRHIAQARPQALLAVVETLRRGCSGTDAMARARAAVLAAGAHTDWSRYFPRPGRVTALPAYPWQREHHWAVPKEQAGCPPVHHPLLGSRVTAPSPLWAGAVEPALVPWLADHRIAGSVVMPATGYVEMALAAGRLAWDAPVEVEHLDISSALVVNWADASAVRMQVALDHDTGLLQVTSTDEHAGKPRAHARARVRTLLASRPAPLDPDALRRRCTRQVKAEDHYTACTEAGLGYGPAFRVLTELHAGEKEVLAHYTHPAPGAPYTVHPALLDGALQAGAPLLADLVAEGQAWLPAAVGAVRVWATPSGSGIVAVRERSRTDSEICWDITLADLDGTVTARLDGCRLRRFTGTRTTRLAITHTVLRAAPRDDDGLRSSPSPMPVPSRVITACTDRIAEARTAWRKLDYGGNRERFLELAARTTAMTLSHFLPEPDALFTEDDLVRNGLQQHKRLIALMRPLMEQHGVLHTEAGGRHRLACEPTAETRKTALTESPQFAVASALYAHHSVHLTDILRGDRDPMELLTHDASARLLELFYDVDPFCHFYNRLARTLLKEMIRTWPRDRPLRILEVGAGTGGITAQLLPVLPPERTRYCYTDISTFFFTRARARFAAHDFVEYRTFDLDTPPAEQGFPPQAFDLVVAGNALHTAKDLAQALGHIAGLLAPGGALLAFETHTPEMLAMLFGTLDSFYGNTDTTLRPCSVILPREQWPGLLTSCGFTHVVQTGDADDAPGSEDGSVLLATVPATGPSDEAPAPGAPAGAVHLVAAETAQELPLATALTEFLTADGESTARAVLAPRTSDEWDAVIARGDDHPPAVVLLLGELTADTPDEVVAQTAHRAEIVRTWSSAVEQRQGDSSRPELWVVARPHGCAGIGTDAEQPADAATWALTRSLANERPDIQCRRVSLSRTGDLAADARRLARELCTPGDEDEIVLTAQGRFVLREQYRSSARPAVGGLPHTLRVRSPGLSYELFWQETARPGPGPGEVLVDVRATALNYRDIMQATGLLPAEAGGGPSADGYGMECAGLVVACGEGVSRPKPGDRIACIAANALGSWTVARAEAVFPLPDDTTFTEGATMPVAYATAVHSLGALARLRPGETVLVHGAAGGVGLAALRYAHARGAAVIATAGSDLKRNYLRGLGVTHVLDSRSLDFADRIRALTGGRGVDVVLNSLAGEAMTRSLELLRPGGRFLELGKRDFYENKPLLLRPFNNNIAFFGVDLTKIISDGRQLAELVAQFDDPVLRDVLRPLPHSTFPAARVGEAFAFLQHSRHIGKVVVAFDPLDEPPLVEPLDRAPRLDPAGTYLVTGGTGGFGARTARWLADLGARHLALVSRRGPDAPEAAEVLTALRAQGVQATAYAADAADLTAMTGLVAGIDAQGHPLRGVVHAAMHLDDEALRDLDQDRITAVLRPKIGGAIVLDRLTRNRECDLFLMYSSAAALIGNIKQAPYAAGNLYLEALARSRRRAGLPGTAIAWGVLDAGYVARSDLAVSLSALGMTAVGADQAFGAAGKLLQESAEAACVARTDWATVSGLFTLTAGPRLAGLVPAGSGARGRTEELLCLLRQLPAEEALALLAQRIAAQIAEVTEMEASQVDLHRPLDSFGLDSLMAAELLVKFQQEYDIDIPPMELLRSTTGSITDLARLLHLRLGLGRNDR